MSSPETVSIWQVRISPYHRVNHPSHSTLSYSQVGIKAHLVIDRQSLIFIYTEEYYVRMLSLYSMKKLNFQLLWNWPPGPHRHSKVKKQKTGHNFVSISPNKHSDQRLAGRVHECLFFLLNFLTQIPITQERQCHYEHETIFSKNWLSNQTNN